MGFLVFLILLGVIFLWVGMGIISDQIKKVWEVLEEIRDNQKGSPR